MKPKSISMNCDSGEKTWLTPPRIVNALGPFDIDPCCPSDMPWRTATEMVSLPNDGLCADWNGKRVWCNPPYGREAIPFLEKLSRHAGGGYALVFARTDTAAWQRWIFPFAVGALFVKGRIRFYKADGTPGETSPAPSAIIAYSEDDYAALQFCGIEGKCLRFK